MTRRQAHEQQQLTTELWPKVDDGIVGHGISLLWWRSGGVEHPTICRLHRFMLSPTLGHSSSIDPPYDNGQSLYLCWRNGRRDSARVDPRIVASDCGFQRCCSRNRLMERRLWVKPCQSRLSDKDRTPTKSRRGRSSTGGHARRSHQCLLLYGADDAVRRSTNSRMSTAGHSSRSRARGRQQFGPSKPIRLRQVPTPAGVDAPRRELGPAMACVGRGYVRDQAVSG
jgi:hypothetical protein